MSSWHSYPSSFNLGHRILRNLFTVPINVEEKVDGSQFSFGLFNVEVPAVWDERTNPSGTATRLEQELKIRSKGCIMSIEAPEKMFNKAAATVRELAPLLHVGWTYRAEYLQNPKHNALPYDRVPAKHLIIFDICRAEEDYLSYGEKAIEAARLGLEVVPLLMTLGADDPDAMNKLRTVLDTTTSVLGGQKIEGVVMKQVTPTIFGPDKKLLIGKFVSEAFKEVHRSVWKGSDNLNATKKDFLDTLCTKYCHPGRWAKAVQHGNERGALQGAPSDIATLIKDIPADIQKECADEIKEALWKWAWPQISRGSTKGFPEWYKDQLMRQQFDQAEADQPVEVGV